MVSIVIGMLLCVALAVGVVLLVAVPARREGRDLLTPRGEEVVGSLREAAGRGRGFRAETGPGAVAPAPGEPETAQTREGAPTR